MIAPLTTLHAPLVLQATLWIWIQFARLTALVIPTLMEQEVATHAQQVVLLAPQTFFASLVTQITHYTTIFVLIHAQRLCLLTQLQVPTSAATVWQTVKYVQMLLVAPLVMEISNSQQEHVLVLLNLFKLGHNNAPVVQLIAMSAMQH